MTVPFVGGSYELARKKSDTQRTINMCPTPIESGSGKAAIFLQSIPGLTQFSTAPAPTPPPHTCTGGPPLWAALPPTEGSGSHLTIAFGDGVFIIPNGVSSSISYSTDFMAWTTVAVGGPASNYQYSAYGAGAFVVTSSSFANVLYSVNNGVSWAVESVPFFNPACLAYGNSRFIAYQSGSATMFRSSAGGPSAWSSSTCSAGADSYAQVVYLDPYFYVFANRNTYRTIDGVTMTAQGVLPQDCNPNATSAVAIGNGVIMVTLASQFGTGGLPSIMRSADLGGTWTEVQGDFIPATDGNIHSVVFGAGVFILNCADSLHSYVSATGAAGTWVQGSNFVSGAYAMVYANDIYYAAGALDDTIQRGVCTP